MGTLNTTEEMAENCTQPHLQDIREMLLEFNRTGDRERLCRAMNVRLEYGSAALKQKDISLCSDLAQLFRVGCLDHAELASLLLCAGLPVNSPDHDGGTLLHGAAACGRLAMARWLVARGAHVDAVGLYEWTPLMYAAENGHLEMVRYLVQVGANTTIRDEDGYNALYYARAPEVERYLEQLPQ
ncbi:26S proteasome non-ATPase regulatory subunit 10-like isoform X2 [Bacillus rossius redtenbacheri]